MDEVWAFAAAAVQFLESKEYINGFSPFGYMDDLYNVNSNNALLTADGLTPLGHLYATS